MLEEEKAIESLKKHAYTVHGILSTKEAKTVLNLIQKQQEEIEANDILLKNEAELSEELKEEIEEQDITIDRLTKEQEEIEKYTHSLETELEKKDKNKQNLIEKLEDLLEDNFFILYEEDDGIEIHPVKCIKSSDLEEILSFVKGEKED